MTTTEHTKTNGVSGPARHREVDADPLAKLPHLRRVAMRGAQIIEARDEPIDWFWRGIAASDHHVEVAGPSYSGKTTLAMLLTVAAANPTRKPVSLFGHDVTPIADGQFGVVVEAENSARSASAKLVSSCEMLGLPVAETLARVILVARAEVIAHAVTASSGASAWSEILTLGQRGHVGLVVLDSRARVLSTSDRDTNDERDQAHVARVIQQAMQHCGSPVVVVSHTRKSGAESIEDLAGSHQRGAGADTILLVTAQRSGGRVLRSRVAVAKLRDGDDEHPAPVTFGIAKRDGVWTLTHGDDDAPTDALPHERVFAILADRGELTARQIREAIGVSGVVVARAIGTLRAERRVTSRTTILRGRERETYRAIPTWNDLDPSKREETDA